MELLKISRNMLVAFSIFFAVNTMALPAEQNRISDLLDIYHLALKNDMTLAAARATYKANLENTPIARSALLPQISLTAQTSWNRQINQLSDAVNLVKNNGADKAFGWNSHGWGASLSQPIFDVSTWFSLQAAKAQNLQDLAVFKTAQQDLIMRVASAYFEVLHLEDTLKTMKAERRAVKRQLTQARERYHVGLLPKADVEEAKATYDAVAVKVIEAENEVNLSYKKLATITALPSKKLASLNARLNLSRPRPQDPDAWVKKAIENNFDMKAAKAGINASQYTLKASQASRLPTIAATVSFNHDISNTTRKLNKADTTVYGLTLTLPLFTGGNTSSTITQNRFLLENAEHMAELQQRIVSEHTLSFYDSINADLAKINAACQGVVSAKIALKVTESGYVAGIRTIMDVLQSQQTLYSALQSSFNSRYSYIIDTLKLKKATGILSPADLIELNHMLDKNNDNNDSTETMLECQAIIEK